MDGTADSSEEAVHSSFFFQSHGPYHSLGCRALLVRPPGPLSESLTGRSPGRTLYDTAVDVGGPEPHRRSGGSLQYELSKVSIPAGIAPPPSTVILKFNNDCNG